MIEGKWRSSYSAPGLLVHTRSNSTIVIVADIDAVAAAVVYVCLAAKRKPRCRERPASPVSLRHAG